MDTPDLLKNSGLYVDEMNIHFNVLCFCLFINLNIYKFLSNILTAVYKLLSAVVLGQVL